MSYQPVWPGTSPNRGQDAKYHSTPIVFTSPTFNGGQNYSRVAFEADLPRIEAPDFGGGCNRFTGVGCVNPPPGSNFYPIYSTGTSTETPSATGHCVWQFGGPVSQGHDEHLRRDLGVRVRNDAVVQLLSEPESGDPEQDEQLPDRAELEPVSGLAG